MRQTCCAVDHVSYVISNRFFFSVCWCSFPSHDIRRGSFWFHHTEILEESSTLSNLLRFRLRSPLQLPCYSFPLSFFTEVGTFRWPPVHGLPKWTTLKILFRMSTIDPCVSSISNSAYLSLNTHFKQYLSLSTHFKKVSFRLLLWWPITSCKLTFLKWVLRLQYCWTMPFKMGVEA